MQYKDNTPLLKDRIKQFHLQKTKIRLRPVPTLSAAAEHISSKLAAAPKKPPDFELEIIEKKFRQAIDSGHWQDISDREWKWAPYLWFNQSIANEELLVDKYLIWLQANQIASNWRHLIFVYLRHFNHRHDYNNVYKKLSQAIRDALYDNSLGLRLQRWKQRHDAFELFSERFVLDRAISAFFNTAKSNLRQFANMTGLHGELSQVGYAEAVGLEMLHTSPIIHENHLDSVRSYHLTQDGNLRFPSQRVDLIEFHLSPWLRNKNIPSESSKLQIQAWLLKHFGDPRLAKHRKRGWRDVGDKELQVVCRWLAGETLEQFFSIIDELALEHQWEYRKAFWKAYYDRGLLNDAWVALGPAAWRYARESFGSTLAAAQLQGATDDQSVLLVRIENLIFAEWSHHGKCRAWKDDNRNAPRMYDLSYDRNDLVKESVHIVHHHRHDGISHQASNTYWWQNQLAKFIYNETSVRIQERDYHI